MHYLILLRVVQLVELNDERNWRSGLRVRLLSACMVTICSLYQLHMRSAADPTAGLVGLQPPLEQQIFMQITVARS